MKALLLFLATGMAFAAGWEAVQEISPGHKIEVMTRDGKDTRGVFVSASENTLVVRSKSGEDSFARGDIRRVRVADPSRRARNGLIGTAIGAGIGLAIGAAVCPQCPNEGSGAKYMGPLTAAGAGVGAAAGFLPAPYRTVYKSK
jgi:hypothetical protein